MIDFLGYASFLLLSIRPKPGRPSPTRLSACGGESGTGEQPPERSSVAARRLLGSLALWETSRLLPGPSVYSLECGQTAESNTRRDRGQRIQTRDLYESKDTYLFPQTTERPTGQKGRLGQHPFHTQIVEAVLRNLF